MKHLKQLYIFIFVSILMAIAYLFLQTINTQTLLNTNVETIIIDEAKTFAKNIEHNLKKHIKKDPYIELKNNKFLKEHLESSLEVIRNDTFKYIFVLYRDKHGNYRFLLDGSKEKAFFNQRLNVDKKLWNQVYSSKKPLIVKQKKLDGLWITYLYPLVIDNKTEAVIAIDFSKELPQNIYNAISPLNNIFLYIFIAISFLILILLYQTFLSMKNKKESITDPLTQAFNRNYMRDLLQKINIHDYQIMMCDIDHFKQINDNYGHKAGDFVLAKVAEILKTQIRAEDILIRFGGEEFLLFIKRKKSQESMAYIIAQRIRQKIEESSFKYEDKEIRLTLSIGISCQPEHFKTISEAIKYADEMLYIAKREGRNKVVSTAKSNIIEDQISKKSINDVKAALEEDRIICYFQAIYNVKTKKCIKYEALVRLKEPNGTITPPALFLESIMYTNVYNDLTKTVLENVFDHIKEKKVVISVNLNFSDILDTTIYTLILNELKEHQKLAPWLIIELLEYEILSETSTLIQERLKMIKSFGVKIAIDDFGSGYSNYTMFKSLPIDILKIDGSLIKDLDISKTSHIIADSIVLLAKELGIKTVAEFVHSKAVLDEVERLEIDEAQGFYLAKPQADID